MLGGNWARTYASHTGGEGKESIRMSTTMLTKMRHNAVTGKVRIDLSCITLFGGSRVVLFECTYFIWMLCH